MTVMDFPSSPVNGQTTTDGRYYFDSSVGSTGAWRSTPLPVGGLPAGSIIQWSSNTAPANWLICDGSAVSRSVYSSLFAVIGTTYGAGDGSTTFNLPDLRGRVPVGKNGGTFGTLGGTGGAETHTLTEAQIPSHSHRQNDTTTYDRSNTVTWGATWSTSNDYKIAMDGNGRSTYGTGGGQAHNNLQPYLVVNYIIKATAGWTAGDSELATRVGAVETANATTNKSGLVPVIPTSVSVSAGSATVSASGLITCTNVVNLTISGCFTSTYPNYRLTGSIASVSAALDLVSQLTGSSTLSSGYYGLRYGTSSNTFTNSGSATIARSESGGSFFTGDIKAPFLARSKQWLFQTSDAGNYYLTHGFSNTSTTSYTGMVLGTSGASWTGEIQLYGYR